MRDCSTCRHAKARRSSSATPAWVSSSALIVFFGILEPDRFLTYNNFISLIRNEAVAGIVALGVLIPLAAGSFDVSIGGTMTLACVSVTWQFQATEGSMPIPIAILVVLVTAVIIGLVNSLLVVRAGVEPLIATIGTSTILVGISQMIGNGETITFHIPSSFTTIGRGEILGIPNTLIIFGVLALLMWYVLAHTPAGRLLYATGAGREAARLSGVRTGRVVTAAYVTSALGASIAGIVFAARLGSGPPGAGAPICCPRTPRRS